MKHFVIVTILLAIVTTPIFAELSSDDLLKISDIVDKSIKDSETRLKEYVDIKIGALETNMRTGFDSVDKRFNEVGGKINILTAIVCALIALIGIAIIPQYIFLLRSNKTTEQDRIIKN